MPSCNTYRLTWVSLTLDVGYLFIAAPAKCSRCSLPWTRGISSLKFYKHTQISSILIKIFPQPIFPSHPLLSLATSSSWSIFLLYIVNQGFWKKVKESEVTQCCLPLCYPMDCSLPGSSVHEIFQAKILEWVAISFSRRSSWPRDQTRVSCIVCRRFYCLSHKGRLLRDLIILKVSKSLPSLTSQPATI